MEETGGIITKNPLETAKIGSSLADSLVRKKRGENKQAMIVCLYGELGSGKTTFAQGFAKGLGITTRLLSPTFIIVRRYELSANLSFLYHIDLYRIPDTQSLEDLGLPEILSDRNACVLVEWAEKLGSFLPKNRVDVRFTTLPDDSHEITIHTLYGR